MSGTGWGARAGIATAAALLTVCLAGTPLYVSASGSQAIQDQLAQTCPADVALGLVVTAPAGRGDPAVRLDPDEVRSLLDGVPDVAPAVAEHAVRITVTADGGLPRGLWLFARDGAGGEVRPPFPELGPDELAMSDGNLRVLGIQQGDGLAVTDDEVSARVLTVAHRFDDLPFQPDPAFWCGYARFLRPTGAGDPPPSSALAAAGTVASFEGASSRLEFRLADRPLTRREVTAVARSFDEVTARVAAQWPEAAGLAAESVLPTLLARAGALADAVARSIAPVRLVGAVAALVVLVAAAVMLARERRRELRLAALRGASPWRTALQLLPAVALPVGLGGGAGLGLAVLGVRTLGPTPEIEPPVLVGAVLAAATGLLGATVLVAVTAAVAGDRLVDSAPRRRHWHAVPLELVAVGLALWSFRRLDQVGGVRMFGVEARGGALLAQAFPLLAVVAAAAVAARPLRFAAGRLRRSGARWPRGPRLGWRRAVAEPVLVTALVSAVMLATGCFALSSSLAASSARQLDDKAATFVGADLAVSSLGPIEVPASVADRATVVMRFLGEVDGRSFDVLGVDRDELARVVAWRGDASERSLAELLDAIEPVAGGPIPAVLVAEPDAAPSVDAPSVDAPPAAAPSAPEPVDVTTLVGAPALTVRPVASAAFFPGYQNGRRLAVVDRDALVAAVGETGRALWVRDPPAGLVEQMRASGTRVTFVQRADGVFDTSSYSAQRWSYAALGALGALFATVVIAMQLLVVEARRDSRRLAHLVLRRTGFGLRSLWSACVVEVGVPLVLGTVLGTAAGVAAASASLRRLDPLPGILPPARVVVPLGPLVALGAVVLASVVVLAGLAVRSTRRCSPMEVIRGTA